MADNVVRKNRRNERSRGGKLHSAEAVKADGKREGDGFRNVRVVNMASCLSDLTSPSLPLQ